ncbi:hypothetical protein EDB81DRAFT_900338 [Dactylonectria macrodidyma]|uniref:Uncharacterized protein n=1 Tax=Dactylonectria macrodidyma TaxID=307937 RepID=A0A9P9EJW6_9HYPO|nr:hypothetical protein EDB81DRAFT_900338 [Dactylonectria macrodidyma]
MDIVQLHNDQKFELLAHIWPQMPRDDYETYARLYGKYFLYLEEQMSLVQRKPSIYSIGTIDHLTKLIEHIRGTENGTKADISSDGSSKSFNSIDIAVRIWLTIDVQHSSVQFSGSFHWPEDINLSGALEDWFTPPQDTKDKNIRQVPVDFSILNLIRYYQFKVTWTSDLLQHLKVDWKHKKIMVFEHGICLRNHIEYPSCPLPRAVVQEAIDTLILLFPNDRDTNEFLLEEGRTFLGVPYGRGRSLSLASYCYWQRNLSDLIDHWEQGPKGWSQMRLKPDRGNLLEYVTFWAATFVLVLTILSIAFGVASLVLAKQALHVSIRSLEVSVQSYNLALAMACTDSNATETLPGFCN